MKDKKKILSVAGAVLCVALVLALYFFISDRNARFEMSEKNTVAMGTIVTQKLYGDSTAKEIDKITAIINGLEQEISCHEETSLVSRLNSGEELASAGVASIIRQCNEISSLSGGVFDVSVGGLVKLWSIGEPSQKIPTESEIARELEKVSYKGISLQGDTISLPEGAAVDLGAVGKGAACDNVMAYLRKSNIKGAVVSVGGSILAYGSYNKAGDKWQIAVRHPRSESDYLGIISLSEGFVSTSGDYERYFEENGVRYHHILDATTGYPAQSDIISATVVCDSGVLSDALSTACFILGEEKSKPLLEKYSASAVFVDRDMNVSTVGDIDFERK